MATNPINLRLNDDQAAWISDRSRRALTGESAGQRVKTELDLWRSVQEAELARLKLTLAELNLLADIMNNPIPAPVAGGYAVLELIDARAGQEGLYGAKWGVDEAALLDKLSRLGPAGDYALVDAISRWWQQGDHSHNQAAAWEAVGIKPLT
jgi:hypothetical protein